MSEDRLLITKEMIMPLIEAARKWHKHKTAENWKAYFEDLYLPAVKEYGEYQVAQAVRVYKES